MKTAVKILMAIGLVGTMVGCKSTFNATEKLQVEENRNAVYKEIISNPVQFTNFISEAQKNEEAKKILMKAHMEQMESGNMKMMMEKNPEMKEKMESHMQKMMGDNPEMMQKMQAKMLDKMMENEKGRKMLMDEIHSNKTMKKEMKAKMMQMMDENPEMKEEMMQKMMEKNPEMMQKMKGKMKNEG
ncbi:hypothetical protein SAMN05421636_102253 [Pricia antarctica]|uniref:XPC-binding domain-containing protein n=1 Tax=Pricia antarctica TaxID=641691 RepID=A0A1G6YJ68_9FLAO|nr:hypothetical protein [Pricia antarctica]SDD89596.1 hypothetical protein SAMN05421636_102253 [Pricia antarctica]